jgi:3-dehydroquinate synthase
MEEVRLNLAERSYSILIGEGLLASIGSILQERQIDGRILVITNPTVARWYREPLIHSLQSAGFSVQVAEVPDGESYKSLEQASFLYDTLIDGAYDRKSLLIALGGGVIGDLTGFVAATYMRGVRFIQIPTTLLAQVDSSIGGKVAVNHPKGKNLIGAFYQPSLVITDVTTLKTLPEAEFNSGMAEVIKHGFILDENYLRLIAGEYELIHNLDPEILSFVVSGSCRIKSEVVEQDEKESGLRAILNFGHTIGHAIEAVTNYTYYKHGEGVALGMLAASQIAARTGRLKEADLPKNLLKICQKFKLPTKLPGLAIQEILEAIKLDKKVESAKVRWVLPEKVGIMKITSEVPAEVITEVLVEMGGLR